jgi:hypothetical protein
MKSEELRLHIRRLADSRCKAKHPDYYDSLICVGPGSTHGLGPPCDGCVAEVEHELEAKRAKAHGRELSPEEAAKMRRELGLDDGVET